MIHQYSRIFICLNHNWIFMQSPWFLFKDRMEQKQPYRSVLRKTCSENMYQIYKRAPITKCYLSKIVLVFSFKFSAYFQKPFHRNTSRGLLLIEDKRNNFREWLWVILFVLNLAKWFINARVSVKPFFVKKENT